MVEKLLLETLSLHISLLREIFLKQTSRKLERFIYFCQGVNLKAVIVSSDSLEGFEVWCWLE